MGLGLEEGGGCKRSAADENRTRGGTGDGSSADAFERAPGDGGGGAQRAGWAAGDASEGRPDMTAPATPPMGMTGPPVERRWMPGREFMPLVLFPEKENKIVY